MKNKQNDLFDITITDTYKKGLPSELVENIESLLTTISMPNVPYGLIGLQANVLNTGVDILVFVFNNGNTLISEEFIKLSLFDKSNKRVAIGLINNCDFPRLKSNSGYVWHFTFPNESFIEKDVNLGEWKIELLGYDNELNFKEEQSKDNKQTPAREYPFFKVKVHPGYDLFSKEFEENLPYVKIEAPGVTYESEINVDED